MKRLNITVYGRVQGIGFRYSALHAAQRLGVKGFVKNCYDGTVYLEAEGDDEPVESFLEWCKKGPSLARVERVVTEQAELRLYTGFEIR